MSRDGTDVIVKAWVALVCFYMVCLVGLAVGLSCVAWHFIAKAW